MLGPIAQCKERNILPQLGTRVQIVEPLQLEPSQCDSFFVKPNYIRARKAGAKGMYLSWVAGAGGDLWWIKHDDGDVVAVYMSTEVVDELKLPKES